MPDRDLFRVLLVCTGNRARSQMAHGWMRHLGGARVLVESAGTEPRGVHPMAVEVMAEVGIDISGHTSDHVDRYAGEEFDLVVTLCDSARETCPVFPGAGRLLHHSFEDPDRPGMGDKALREAFRRVRDQIGEFSRTLLAEELSRRRDTGADGRAPLDAGG